MNFREIARVLGKYFFYFSFILIIPLAVSIYYDFIEDPSIYPQSKSSHAFFLTLLFSFLISGVFWFFGKKAKGILYRKESILIVVLIWLITASISAFPFYFSKTLNLLDSHFESLSGLSTTGASVMTGKKYNEKGAEIPLINRNVHVPNKTYVYYGTIKPVRDEAGNITHSGLEAVSRGVLFWRSFIQWLGGMGIVVLFLSILPALSVGGKVLFQTEVPGPIKETMTPRIKETASILWKLYLSLTIIEIYLLIWTNGEMPLFDAFCITFSTLSTGGFTIINSGIGGYNNLATEMIILIFMTLGSINFGLYFYLLKKKFYRIYEPDFLFFLFIIFAGVFLVSFNLVGKSFFTPEGTKMVYSWKEALRYGSFQAISAQTSTGFTTANYDLWPFPPQLFMLLLMYFGGMSGSTAGGLKTSRFFMLFKNSIYKIESIFKPEKIKKFKIGNTSIPPEVINTVLIFFFVAVCFAVIGTIIFVLDGIDPETAFSTVTCMMNNIGMSFRAAGPTESFAFLPPVSKVTSMIWMLFGRLEFFAILLLFIPGFWKKQ